MNNVDWGDKIDRHKTSKNVNFEEQNKRTKKKVKKILLDNPFDIREKSWVELRMSTIAKRQVLLQSNLQ